MKTIMKKILFTLLTLVLFSTGEIKAQNSFFSLQYSMGFGMGDTKDFISPASFRGVGLEYRYFPEPAVGVGFETGYNLFYERKNYATYTQGAESLSGVQYRYIHFVPVLAAVDYYFIPDTKFNPFAGLGLGTLFSEKTIEMGVYNNTTDVWQFSLRPEIGVLFAAPGFDLIVAGKYFTAFKANDNPAQNYFAINLGILF